MRSTKFEHIRMFYSSVLIKFICIAFLLMISLNSFGQPLPGDTGLNAGNSGPVGGGAPLETSSLFLTVLAVFYLIFKFKSQVGSLFVKH